LSYNVSGTTITLTRGDTFMAQVSITDADGNAYNPVEGDAIRFAMKKQYTDPEPLLIKQIPIDTMKLIIDPDDTKKLAFDTYKYDIELTKASGDVDTFINGRLKLTEEVY